jgi:hypothetical protein
VGHSCAVTAECCGELTCTSSNECRALSETTAPIVGGVTNATTGGAQGTPCVNNNQCTIEGETCLANGRCGALAAAPAEALEWYYLLLIVLGLILLVCVPGFLFCYCTQRDKEVGFAWLCRRWFARLAHQNSFFCVCAA